MAHHIAGNCSTVIKFSCDTSMDKGRAVQKSFDPKQVVNVVEGRFED